MLPDERSSRKMLKVTPLRLIPQPSIVRGAIRSCFFIFFFRSRVANNARVQPVFGDRHLSVVAAPMKQTRGSTYFRAHNSLDHKFEFIGWCHLRTISSIPIYRSPVDKIHLYYPRCLGQSSPRASALPTHDNRVGIVDFIELFWAG